MASQTISQNAKGGTSLSKMLRYSSKNEQGLLPIQSLEKLRQPSRLLGNLFKGQAAIVAVLPEKYSAQAASLNATVTICMVSHEVVLTQCPLGNNRHWRSQCSDFRSKSLEERIKITRAKGLCIKCL